MPDLDDVRRLVAGLPEVEVSEPDDRPFAAGVCTTRGVKGFAWTWLERPADGAGRVARPDVPAVRTPGVPARDELVAAAPDRFFTEPHYRSYPAVLVRLGVIGEDELRELLLDGWRVQAPKRLARQHGLA